MSTKIVHLGFWALACVFFCACSKVESPALSETPARSEPPLQGGRKNPFSASSISSYFTGDGPDYFARKNWAKARQSFADDLARSSGADADRLTLLIAECDRRLGRHAQAAESFDALQQTLPMLVDYLRLTAADSYFAANELDKAKANAARVSKGSIHRADADMLLGDILRQQATAEEIYKHYSHYLSAYPDGPRQSEASYYLAKAALDLRHFQEGASALKKLTVQVPMTRWGIRAKEALLAVSSSLSPKLRKLIMTYTAEEYLERGFTYYRMNRSVQSEALFRSALRAPGLDPDKACVAHYHLANSVYKQRDRKKAFPLFKEALGACKTAGNDDLYVKAAYQAGKSLTTLGQHERAIEYHHRIEAEHPEHSYADDARLHQADALDALNQPDAAYKYLREIPQRYPSGDMTTEALWRLAWREYKAKRYQKAIRWLTKQIAASPVERHFWAEGQAEYWLARSYAHLGQTKKSIRAFKRTVRTYPLSYYSLLALNRLRESHPKAYRALVAEIGRKRPKKNGALTFRPRREYKRPAFKRALEFLRLGLTRPARAELTQLGFHSPTGREPLTKPDDIDRVWAMAFINHALGNVGRAVWWTRWHVVDYKRHWPEGGWRERWEIAYPLGYETLVRKRAKQQGVDPELVWAIVREESGFDPLQESVANAIGLSQIIMPTAKRFAPKGLSVNRGVLQDPDKNLHIGTRFLSFLLEKWDGDISLIPPSYNAGENAVARWMQERGDWDRDEWAEEIPYDETRRYSKRVLASYFTYRYLLEGEIPLMPNQRSDAPK